MQGIFFGTKGGEIHFLRLPSFYDETAPTYRTWDTTGTPSAGQAVTGTFRSRDLNFGDWDVIKTIRRIAMTLTGTNVQLTLAFRNSDGSQTSLVTPGLTYLTVAYATPDISTAPRRIRGLGINLSGTAMELRTIDFEFQQKRVN
jgi:hypothetical protein